MRHFYIWLFCTAVFSQAKPVAITIDSLAAADSGRQRSFTLQYTIANLTGETIHFILNPNAIIPIGAGSLNPSVYYKVYENESSIDVSGIFTISLPSSPKTFNDEAEMKKYHDSIFKSIQGKSLETLIKESKDRTRNNIQELKPNESRQYEAVLNWDKTRYFTNDQMEYYLNETAEHFFELHINLMQDELLTKFSEDEKAALLKDKNMVKGWFSSQKVAIDLGE